jgi:hypothetical protein
MEKKMSKELWLKRIRNYAGFLGMILPWISLIGTLLLKEKARPSWSDFSISATYYVTPALTAILTSASIVLMCYDGYDKWDSFVTTISGVFGLCIVLFPCKCNVSMEHVGYFQLPIKVSNILHCTSAMIFFILLAYNDIFLFTKHEETMTSKKKIRNMVYIICGIGMLSAMILIPLPIHFNAKTWWVEMVALTFFGISWLTKGEVFKFLND